MDFEHETEAAEINARLQSLIDEADEPPPWSERWERLAPDASHEERLAVYREIRDAGTLPEPAAWYLISTAVDPMAVRRGGAALRKLGDRVADFAQKAGRTSDDLWEPGEGPPEFERLRRKYCEAFDAQVAAVLDECGETELAERIRTDRAQFRDAVEEGRHFFHGDPDDIPGDPSELPEWINDLVDAIAAHLAAENDLGPLGIRYRRLDSGRWEVVVHPTPVELVGGASDGAVVSPVFSIDVESLRCEFDQVDGCGVCSHGMFADESAFVWIDGLYAGRPLTLRLLLEPPENEAPGSRIDVNRRDD